MSGECPSAGRGRLFGSASIKECFLKIVHLLWGLTTGGIENMLVDIVNVHVNENDVSLIIINDMIDESVRNRLDPRVKVFECKRKRESKNPWPLLKMNLLLIKLKPQIVHVHYDGIVKFVLGKWNVVRTIHGMRNSVDESVHCKACYAISKSVQDEWIQQGHETILVENGVCCDKICSERKSAVSDTLHLIQVSRMYFHHKGQDILIRALADVKKRGTLSKNIQMHFVGDGCDMERAKQLVQELGVEDIVVFEGSMPREWVYENLCNFDLYIQPSRQEGFGLTVAEAMAAKVPVLVSALEGPMEILNPDGFDTPLGWSFDPESVDDLSRKIKKFVNEGYDDGLADKAYAYIRSRYDIKNTAERYVEEYAKF